MPLRVPSVAQSHVLSAPAQVMRRLWPRNRLSPWDRLSFRMQRFKWRLIDWTRELLR